MDILSNILFFLSGIKSYLLHINRGQTLFTILTHQPQN